jgi:hypothetical protein
MKDAKMSHKNIPTFSWSGNSFWQHESKLGKKERNICPVSGVHCDEKKNTCEPDWGGHGEPAYCHLK